MWCQPLACHLEECIHKSTMKNDSSYGAWQIKFVSVEIIVALVSLTLSVAYFGSFYLVLHSDG